MKKNVWNGVALLLAALAVLALAGCPQEVGTLNSDASVSRVTVSGSSALTLGTPDIDWQKAVANPGHVYVDGSKLKQAEIAVSAAKGGKIFLAQAKRNLTPYFVSDKVFDFDPDDFLFIEVFSENLDACLIYAIVVHTLNPGLSDITVGGRSLFGGQSATGQPIPKFGDAGKPGTAWNEVEQEGEVWYGDDQEDSSLPVTLTPETANFTVRVSTSADASTAPDFNTPFSSPATNGVVSGLNVTVKDGGYMYI